jgi:hypothetical protein
MLCRRTASCCTLIRYYDWRICELIAAQPTEYELNLRVSTGGLFTYKVLSVITSMKAVLAQPNNDVEYSTDLPQIASVIAIASEVDHSLGRAASMVLEGGPSHDPPTLAAHRE